MNNQERTGWGVIAAIILALWWLFTRAQGFMHGTTKVTTGYTPSVADDRAIIGDCSKGPC